MSFVKAGPNAYLLVGQNGKLENRGSAVQAFLMPGSIYVLVPSTKQEATFEFTQETRDGIPLRFKGIILYRITDPVAAARMFDFSRGAGTAQITAFLTHLSLGELRHAVSHMTMVECIEQRKTTLGGVADAALRATVHASDDGTTDWGITVEVAQVAQVFIVDTQLRQQLEAEVRNEIKLRSEQSNVRTQEETRLAEMESEGRVQEQKLASDRSALRRQEELELTELARQRRMQAENLETQRQLLQLEQERFRAQMAAEQDRIDAEAPVRSFRIAKERDILQDELEMRRLQREVEVLDVERQLLLPRARQDMRREMLPLEQAPRIVDAASKVLQGATLSLYGEDARLLGQLEPLFAILARAVQQSTQVTGVAADDRRSS